ncbi:MAG: cation transporter [Chitinophagales bacterium]|nr:cation transporter [Chitinophagales bacterium]
MKKIFLIMSVVFLGFVANAQTEKLVVKTKIYCDHCIECGSCDARIQNQLFTGLTGVKAVKLDPKAETITVTYNSKKTNAAAIRKAIAKTGYDADDVKADPAGYAALDGCCKKK